MKVISVMAWCDDECVAESVASRIELLLNEHEAIEMTIIQVQDEEELDHDE